MGSGVKKLREQVDRLPLDSALKSAVLEGVETTEDATAASEAASLQALFDRIPAKLRAVRDAVARDERVTKEVQPSAQHPVLVESTAEPLPRRRARPASSSLRTYEVLLILRPTLTDEEAESLLALVRTIAEAGGATVKSEDRWGRRRLAYPLKKFNEGIYHLFVFESVHSLMELDRRMKNADAILRHVIVRTDLEQKRAEKLANKEPKREPKRERPVAAAAAATQEDVPAAAQDSERATAH